MSELAGVLITESDFDVTSEYQKICNRATKSGAIVFFVGLVRDFYNDQVEGEKIEHLELQHYPGMTEALCQEIIDEARERFEFDVVRVVHRVGKISASEQIVMVAVASRQRASAFQAAEFIMDYLKTRATLWKKESGTRGENWLGVKDKDKAATARWRQK